MSKFTGTYSHLWPAVNLLTKIEAGFRCVRCGHPGARWVAERNGEVEARVYATTLAMQFGRTPPTRIDYVEGGAWVRAGWLPCDEQCRGHEPSEKLRVLTTHHLDNDKGNLAWWNLVALCQVCHLQIQGRVAMEQTWPFEHTEWFKPYVAGYNAAQVLGEDLTRDEVGDRLDELLAL